MPASKTKPVIVFKGPPPSTEFGRQCMLRGIPTAWIARTGLATHSAAESWRQGWRLPNLATATLLAAGVRKEYRWKIAPQALLDLMGSEPKDTP